MKKVSIMTTAVLCIVVAIVTYVFTASSLRDDYNAKLDAYHESMKPFEKLLQINDYVQNYYVGEIDQDKLMLGIYDGYFAGLGDQFSMYHTKEDVDEMNLSNSGKLVGIGVIVAYDVDYECMYVKRVMAGSPAEEAGILMGDRIVAVNGVTVNQEVYTDVLNSVKGEAGTSVSLTVKRGEQSIDMTMDRRSVERQLVYLDYLEGNIAYIYINEFTGNAATEFIACMKEAQEKGVAGYVFDVRNNPGGDLEVICSILDYLLPEGPIIRVKDAAGNVAYTKDSGASCVDAPMVVLANGDSASAAELFTSALRDYNKATIVGTKTFGKGTMQHIIDLGDGTAIRLSVYYYDPPYGENYHGIGITPDITVELDEYYSTRQYLLNETNDVQLKAAITEIHNIIEGDNK